MSVIGLLMLLAVSGTTPEDRAFIEQAKCCGIKPEQIVWTVDAKGQRHLSITPHGDLNALPFQSLKCMFDWGRRSGTRIGFISEPRPR